MYNILLIAKVNIEQLMKLIRFNIKSIHLAMK